MRSRLRLIGKKIALARRLVSLLTCTQHLRLKYRIHAGLSLALPLSHLSLVQTRRSLALASPRRSSYTHQRAATSSRSFPPLPPSTSPPLLALSSIAYGRSINPFCMILPVRETRRDIASRRFLRSLGDIALRLLTAVVPRGKLGKTLFLVRVNSPSLRVLPPFLSGRAMHRRHCRSRAPLW